jgi:hypothetical protein
LKDQAIKTIMTIMDISSTPESDEDTSFDDGLDTQVVRSNSNPQQAARFTGPIFLAD